MAKPAPPQDSDDKATEAANLAKEAVEAQQEGDAEEARFLANEAKQLDREAADAVLRDAPKGGAR